MRIYQGQDQNRIDGTTGTVDPAPRYASDVRAARRAVGNRGGQAPVPERVRFGHRLEVHALDRATAAARPARGHVRQWVLLRRHGQPGGVLGARLIRSSRVRRPQGQRLGHHDHAGAPYKLGSLGNGKVVFGYDRQTKDRNSFYRRFDFHANQNVDRHRCRPINCSIRARSTARLYSGYVEEGNAATGQLPREFEDRGRGS